MATFRMNGTGFIPGVPGQYSNCIVKVTDAGITVTALKDFPDRLIVPESAPDQAVPSLPEEKSTPVPPSLEEERAPLPPQVPSEVPDSLPAPLSEEEE
jgi:hypothetical protein